MASLYDLVVLGAPTPDQVHDLQAALAVALDAFHLRLGNEIGWLINPDVYSPTGHKAAAAVYFGSTDRNEQCIGSCIKHSIPILPIVPNLGRVSELVPQSLRVFNCLAYADGGATRVASALLECVGLLPRQRRVFLSYRRDEAREAAVQLFEVLSERLFDVFLDTHGVPPGEDFQALLWQRLCDSDVLVMLDTPGYFESRWTNAEFGRALAKGISVLRIGWPDATPSERTKTASRAELLPEEVNQHTGRITDEALRRIWLQLEMVRSQSHAVRTLNLVSAIRQEVERIGGAVSGLGLHKAVYIELPTAVRVIVHPTLGVPTAMTLHDAMKNTPDGSVAVVYDPVGLRREWIQHLDWLGEHIRSPRWVKASEVAWEFADWEEAPNG